ncbi:MAG: hypothetical protein HZB80_06755 [Deltaproteobacteria bacterium]|nr:hypothetical protein [Deltaproteobacteria bacterium]
MNKKAVALLSGGLDSTLAVKVLLDQGVEIVALNFTSTFCTCSCRGSVCSNEAARVANEFGIPIKVLKKGLDYIEVIRNPKYGYGQGMNPCVDCRIYMHRLAKNYMGEIGASFVITGEVLGQRPMSQRKDAFKSIEKESGLDGLIVRPLCAKHLDPTIPEKAGIIDREKLLDMVGRSRKPQISLAEECDIQNYPCPSGGCLLTDKIFSKRVKDLLDNKKDVTTEDLQILKIGRHFRLNNETKIVIGRDEAENKRLGNLVQPGDTLLEPLDFAGPTAMICGPVKNGTHSLAGRMILRYAGEKADGKRFLKLSQNGEATIFEVDSPVDDKVLKGMMI